MNPVKEKLRSGQVVLGQIVLELFTPDSRFLQPYPVYIDRAVGSRKWDIDGNEYVDYFGGHGSLLLGHGHPAVVDAVLRQVPRGTHYGASHELELEWGAYRAIGRILHEIGFSGDLSIELAHEKNFQLTRPLRDSLKISREYVRRVMGY